MGQLYLSNVDFLKNGVPASFIAMMVVATVGFLLMEAIGYVVCPFVTPYFANALFLPASDVLMYRTSHLRAEACCRLL